MIKLSKKHILIVNDDLENCKNFKFEYFFEGNSFVLVYRPSENKTPVTTAAIKLPYSTNIRLHRTFIEMVKLNRAEPTCISDGKSITLTIPDCFKYTTGMIAIKTLKMRVGGYIRFPKGPRIHNSRVYIPMETVMIFNNNLDIYIIGATADLGEFHFSVNGGGEILIKCRRVGLLYESESFIRSKRLEGCFKGVININDYKYKSYSDGILAFAR